MVRTPRRTFATPFVVTLAACGPAQHTSNPPGPAQPPPSGPVASAPSTDPATPAPPPTTGAPAVPDPCEGMPVDAPPRTNPPAPEKFPYEQRWFVSKSGGACLARPKVDCPKPEAGKPTRTCNPPPPIKYECPKNAPSENFTIVQWAGATDCQVDQGNMDCPKNMACNPPPPIYVPCPKR